MVATAHKPLLDARIKRGLSLRAFAQEIGVDPGQMSRIERGMERVSPKTAKRLAEFFGDELTRDQIMFPEEYVHTVKKPVRSAR